MGCVGGFAALLVGKMIMWIVGIHLLTGQVTLLGKSFNSLWKSVVGAAAANVAKTPEARRTILKVTMMK